MGWIGSLVQGVSGLGAAIVNAAAARDAASKQDKQTQMALREARLNEKTRHSEWEASQASSQRRWDAWQNARNKFISEKLGFSMPYGAGGGGGGVVVPTVAPRAAPLGGGTASQGVDMGTPTEPSPAAQQGITLAQIAGPSPTADAEARSWNDWKGYNLA